jgi:hypothetical protein
MKKIIFALLIFASLFSANAMSDFSNRTFCLGFSFPYMRHDYKTDDMDTVTLNGIGLNLNYRNMRDTLKIGLFLDADIFMPFSKTIALDEKTMATTHLSEYEYFFGIDALAGIYTVIFRNANITVPIGAGFHIEGFTSKQKFDDLIVKESVYTLGLGLWLNIEANLTKNFGMFLGTKVIYDFYYKLNYTARITDIQDGSCNCFSVIPALGVLWRF